MTQLELVWDRNNPKDEDRAIKLTTDMSKVLDILLDHKPHLVKEIAGRLSLPECSVSAQIRHLRKEKFGAYTVKLIRITKSLSAYQLEK